METQGAQNSRWYLSHLFGIPKEKGTVRNPYVGGAFGSGLRPQYQLPLAVMAALKLERVVLGHLVKHIARAFQLAFLKNCLTELNF